MMVRTVRVSGLELEVGDYHESPEQVRSIKYVSSLKAYEITFADGRTKYVGLRR